MAVRSKTLGDLGESMYGKPGRYILEGVPHSICLCASVCFFHSHSRSHSHSLSLVLVAVMKSKELKTKTFHATFSDSLSLSPSLCVSPVCVNTTHVRVNPCVYIHGLRAMAFQVRRLDFSRFSWRLQYRTALAPSGRCSRTMLDILTAISV